MSVTIKDSALGKYSISEDHQGVTVLDDKGTTMVKVASLEQALQAIANYLFLEEDTTCSLFEYGEKKRRIFESIIAAQQGKQSNENVITMQQEFPFNAEEVN